MFTQIPGPYFREMLFRYAVDYLMYAKKQSHVFRDTIISSHIIVVAIVHRQTLGGGTWLILTSPRTNGRLVIFKNYKFQENIHFQIQIERALE